MTNTHRSRSPWKRVALALALGAMLGGPAIAQDLTVGWSPRSGDVWVDTWTSDINRYGTRYREPFVDELVRYRGAPRPLVVELLEERRWAPGDVYLACTIASIIGRPCRYVVDAYERDRGQGWGVVAQRLGIKPGSPEFHRLKKGFVTSYDRWARPIDLDDDLRRDFPGRGKGTSAAKGAQAKGAHAGPSRPAHAGSAKPERGQAAKAGGGRSGPDRGKAGDTSGQGKGKQGGKGGGRNGGGKKD